MLKTSGHGSIRKVKGGAVGVLALSTLLVGVGTVSANEASATEQPSVELKAKKEPAEVSDNKKVDADKQESKQETPVKEDSATKESSTEKEVPKDTDKETYKKTESKEFDFAKENAKENGVSVKEDTKPKIKDTDKDAQEDLAKQVKSLKAATKTQIGSDAITSLDKEKLTEAGIRVKDGKVKLFTDLKEMEAFVKQQSKDIASDIEAKHGMGKDAKLATKELKEAGIEVVVGKEIVKSSPKEAMEALKALQAQVTSAVKTKQELDSAYLALQERAKAAGLLTKEGKGITLDSAKDAKDFLNKQVEEVNTLINSLKKENDKLIGAIATAESYGIKVSKGSNFKVASLKDATENVAAQVGKFDALVKSIEESKALISTVVESAKKAGVSLEGEVIVNSAKGEESKLKEKVTSALKELEDATKAQTSAKEQLAKLVEDAKAKGLTVTISGNKKVSVEGVSAELASIKDKISKAIAEKEKSESDYATALKNAKEASRLLEGSTAKKEGDVYKQTLTIKSGGTKGSVNIKATGSAEIVSVELVDPTGKKVESVKTLADLTSYTDFSKQGDYVVNYTFRAKDNAAGSVVSSANTQGIQAVEGKATGTLSVTTNAGTSVHVEYKPRDILVPVDGSGSTAKGTDSNVLEDLRTIADTMHDNDRVMLAFYETNNSGSYYTMGADDSDRPVSRFMSKKEFLDILSAVTPGKENNFKRGSWFNELTTRKLMYNFTGERRSQEIEDLYDQARNKDATAVVIQLTDDWKMPDETYDVSLSEWAKKNAKTFMSVVYGGEDSRANMSMIQAGHPNIYLAEVNGELISNDIRKKKISEQIAATTYEKVEKKENQLVTVSITGTKTAKVTKATLKGATNKDLPIKDGKVNFSEKLQDGTWTVDYELSGDGGVTVTATVAGKEVVKETKNLKEVKGVEAYSATKTDNLNALVPPTAQHSKPITVEDLTVLAKNVLLGTVESSSTTLTVEKELNKTNFKKTVSSIILESEVIPTQAGVTTHDVYLKVVHEKGIPEVLDLPEYHEEKGIPEVHKKEIKEVIAYLDIEDNSVLDDNTTKELPKEAPNSLQNGKYVFTGKTEVVDGITKHYYRKVIPEKSVPEVHENPIQPEGKVLPYTGTEDSGLVQAAGMGIGLLGLLGLAGKRKED